MAQKRLPTVYIGTDHAAFALKEELLSYLTKLGYKVIDKGAFEHDSSDDYPDFIRPVAKAVAASKGQAKGIVLGGSGIGECITANKIRGVRAALVYDRYTARLSREHNDANVMSLGSRTSSGKPSTAKRLVRLWLETPFSGDARHKRRINKLERR